MNSRLTELKRQLRDDYGKITCWQWLCKDRNAKTDEEKIAVAEEVLAIDRKSTRLNSSHIQKSRMPSSA